ncbi:hypothetical protein ALC57_10155, partial [Trachymyrmex cornetzi]
YSISIENGNAKWLDYERENTLQSINMKVRPGELIAVVGQVSAGKSSFLNVILKELRLQEGSIKVNGKIAYASQEPWLFAGSVRQNILFGRKMDQVRYDRVTKVCQLKTDFNLLPYGDKTIVGERGISLSGGQCARINLARAVYADADIYLMDDPLSAVDAHVGKHMFEECIDKYLRGKTRILVTHQLQYLRDVVRIIVLKDGAIQAEGTYDELGSMGVDFGRLLENQAKTDETSFRPASTIVSRSNSHTSISSLTMSTVMTNGTSKQEPLEMSQTDNGVVEDANSPLTRMQCINIYSGLIVSTIIITLIRSWTFFWTCMRASMRLHDRMFRSISRATMRFFNTNTSGRVLNRFSKDMGAVDEMLPAGFIDCLQIDIALLGIIILVATANV